MTSTRPQPSTAVNAALKALEERTDPFGVLEIASALGRHWLADWPAPEAGPSPATYEARVFTRLEKVGGQESLLVAAGLRALGGPDLAARCTTFARSLAARIGPADLDPNDLPVRPVGAWTSDPACRADGRAVIIGLAVDGSPVTVFAFIDHTVGRLATQVSVDRGHRVRVADPRMPEIPVADAKAQIERALARSGRWSPERHPFPGSPADREARAREARTAPACMRREPWEPWDEPEPAVTGREAFTLPGPPADLLLARHLLAALPGGGVDLAPPVLEHPERTRLVTEFLGASGLPPEAAPAARALVDFSADEVDGEPWRWSPEIVRRYLLDGAACRAVLRGTCSADEVEAVMPPWIHHAARHGMSRVTLEASLVTFGDVRPTFRRLVCDAHKRLSCEQFYPRYEADYA